MLLILNIVLLVFLLLLLCIALLNRMTFPVVPAEARPSATRSVSVLVPARNEEKVIDACVRSLLAQDYRPLEVIVLDDDSEDRTGEILAGIARDHATFGEDVPTFRADTNSSPLPDGWLGKNRACHELSQMATGEILLFVDADTRHEPSAVSALIATRQKYGAEFISAVPRQLVRTFWERVIVPMAPFLYFTYLPNRLIPRSNSESLIAANGQMIALDRSTYEQIGGHQAIRGEVLDDVELARGAKRAGLRVELVNARNISSCRMYRSFDEAFAGFSKNLYPGLGRNTILLLFFLLQLTALFLYPLGATIISLVAGPDAPSYYLETSIGLLAGGIFLRGVSDHFFGMSPLQGLLQPLSVITVILIGLNSWRLSCRGTGGVWKGRSLGTDS